MASASGCVDERSTAAASASSSSAGSAGFATVAKCAMRGLPSVRVPVLSKASVSSAATRSMDSPPLMSSPMRAARPMATVIAAGTARPIAQGQAMMSTAMAMAKGCARPSWRPPVLSAMDQAMKASAASTRMVGTKMALARSARRCMGAREDCACASMPLHLREGGGGADGGGAEDEHAVEIERAADDAVAARAGDGQRLAGEHGLVDGAAAVEDDAVDGDAVAGAGRGGCRRRRVRRWAEWSRARRRNQGARRRDRQSSRRAVAAVSCANPRMERVAWRRARASSQRPASRKPRMRMTDSK